MPHLNKTALIGFVDELEKIAADSNKERERLLKLLAAASIGGGATALAVGTSLAMRKKLGPTLTKWKKNKYLLPSIMLLSTGLTGTGSYLLGKAREKTQTAIGGAE